MDYPDKSMSHSVGKKPMEHKGMMNKAVNPKPATGTSGSKVLTNGKVVSTRES